MVQPTTYGNGPFTAQIRWWVTKVTSGGDKDYELIVHNTSAETLFVGVSAYARD